MLWMSICVSLHMHLLCVGLRARLRGLCEWMYAVLCVCVSERILCVSACVCPNVWSILLRHCDWLVPTVTALTDSGGRPLTSTIPHIRLAVLFPSSQLRIVSSLHIMAFVFLSRSRIEKTPAKQKPRQWLGTDSFPPCPCSPCLLPFRSEYMCPEPCWAERKQDTGLTKPCTLAWALPQHTLMPLIQETTVNSVTVCLINM